MTAPVSCAWCGRDGHRIHQCAVRADGRVRPDAFDLEAEEVVARMTDERGHVSVVEARRHIARAMRKHARRARKEAAA